MDYYYEKVELTDQLPAMIGVLDKETFTNHFPNDAFIPSHWHRSLEICLHENVELILRMNEKEYIIKDDFTCINSGVVHSLYAKEIKENAQSMVVLISYDFIKKYYPQIDDVIFDLSLKDNHDDLRKLYERLKQFYHHQDEYTYLEISACILDIMTLLLREYKVDKQTLHKKTLRNQELIKDILTYLQDHYQEDLSLSFMAEQFHMSKEHFSRQFHQQIGKTFKDYLSSYRLYKAYDDVVNSQKTIQDIARIHGFFNVKSFIKIFCEIYHETPLQYRKKMSKQ